MTQPSIIRACRFRLLALCLAGALLAPVLGAQAVSPLVRIERARFVLDPADFRQSRLYFDLVNYSGAVLVDYNLLVGFRGRLGGRTHVLMQTVMAGTGPGQVDRQSLCLGDFQPVEDDPSLAAVRALDICGISLEFGYTDLASGAEPAAVSPDDSTAESAPGQDAGAASVPAPEPFVPASGAGGMPVVPGGPVVRVGMVPGAPRINFADRLGAVGGLEFDLLKSLGERLGINFEIRLYQADALAGALRSHEVALAAAAISLGDPGWAWAGLSDSYARDGTGLVAPDSYFGKFDLAAFKGKKVGVMADEPSLAKVAAELGPDCVVPYREFGRMVQDLVNGDLDALVGSESAIVQDFTDFPKHRDFVMMPAKPWRFRQFALAVDPAEPALLRRINEGIQSLAKDRTLGAITADWLY
jgi:ABC-type amino acid transport substrate-binding protein